MVILDGFAAAAAAAVLHRLAPEALDHVRAAEAPPHAGHARLLRTIGVEPVLAESLDAGPGLAGGAALSLLRLACQAVAAD
jgi:nicotinate-nucleotide--dimethylbenzimidazole phosphoribosyltransferase